MQSPDKTKEQRIDEIVDDLVKTGRLLYTCNEVQDDIIRVGLCGMYRADIKAYREELKQLLKEEDANKQHT